MQSDRVVELRKQLAWRPAYSLTDPFHIDWPNLLGLCLREGA